MELKTYVIDVSEYRSPSATETKNRRVDFSRIVTIPADILSQIFQHLPVKYIGRVATTCRTLMVVIQTSQHLWKAVLTRDEPYWLNHLISNSYLETVKRMPIIWRDKDQVRIMKELEPPTKWRWAIMLFWPHRLAISALLARLLKMPARSFSPKEGVNQIYSKRLQVLNRPLNLVLIDSVRQSIIHGSECGACTSFIHIVDLDEPKSFKNIAKTLYESFGYNPQAKQYIWGVYKGQKPPENEELTGQIEALRKDFESKKLYYVHYAEMNYRTGANVRNTFYSMLMTLVEDARKAEAQMETPLPKQKRLSALPRSSRAGTELSPRSPRGSVSSGSASQVQQRPKSVTNPLSVSTPSPRGDAKKGGSKCIIA